MSWTICLIRADQSHDWRRQNDQLADRSSWTGASSTCSAAEPRVGVLEASRRLRVARGTVQARLDRLERDGVVTGWAPRISPGRARLRRDRLRHPGDHPARGPGPRSAQRLAAIPEVLECWTVTGSGDLWCRIVAHSNADLQRVIDAMVTDPAVVRAVTLIGLAELIPYRTEPLVRQSRLVPLSCQRRQLAIAS